MKCRRVEKLIPLYVEGDLASGLADRIGSHLNWCGRCNWLADEYRESQSWLRSSRTPEFDESTLTDLKAGVLTRIEAARERQSLLASLMQHWSRRQVFALSAAMLIISGVVVFYVYQAQVSDRPLIPEIAKQGQADGTGKSNEPPSASNAGPAPGATFASRSHASKKRLQIGSERAGSTIAVHRLVPPLTTQTNEINWSEPNQVERVVMPDGTLDMRETVRIEIQTSDPNIRIIWFAPKDADSHFAKPITETEQ